jgi:hypothetical protein
MFAQRMIATPTMVSSRSRATTTTTRAAAFEVPSAYKTVAPCAQGVLVKVAAAEKATKGGIILTESAQRKPTSGAYTRVSSFAREFAGAFDADVALDRVLRAIGDG